MKVFCQELETKDFCQDIRRRHIVRIFRRRIAPKNRDEEWKNAAILRREYVYSIVGSSCTIL